MRYYAFLNHKIKDLQRAQTIIMKIEMKYVKGYHPSEVIILKMTS